MNKKVKFAAILLCFSMLAVGCNSNNDTTDESGKESTTATPAATALDTTEDDKMIEKDISKYVTLGNYKGIEATKTVKKVTDDDVTTQIETIRKNNATTDVVTDRTKVKDGDIVNIDYTGYIDGKTFDGGSQEGAELTIGSNSYIDGFEDGLIGAELDKEVELKLKFPDDYKNKDVAGKDVTFKVTVNSIAVSNVPELNEEFVKKVSTESKTVEEYKKEVRKSLEATNEETANSEVRNTIWSAVVEDCKVSEYPEDVVDYYKGKLKDNFEAQLASYYNSTLDEYLENYGKTQDEFDAALLTNAQNYVKQRMVFQALCKELDYSLSDKEYKDQLNDYLSSYYVESEEELLTTYGNIAVLEIKENMLLNKVVDHLVEIGKVKEA